MSTRDQPATLKRSVLVIGAQGVIGTFMARAFERAGWAVTRAGRRRTDDPGFAWIDLDQPVGLAQICKEVDLVVNCVRHSSLIVERTVLANGGAVVDVANDDATPGDRATLQAQAPSAKGFVLRGGGMATLAMLAAAELVAEHADADRVDLGITLSGLTTTGPGGADYVHRLVARTPHHDTERVTLPEPFGSRKCFRVELGVNDFWTHAVQGRGSGQLAMFWPRPFQILMSALNRLHLNRLLPRAAITIGRRKVPKQLSREPVCWWVSASRSGELLGMRTMSGRGDYRITIAATLAVADALVFEHRVASVPAGVYNPQDLFTLEWAERACADDVRIERMTSGKTTRPTLQGQKEITHV